MSMIEPEDRRARLGRVGYYVLAYLAWLANCAVGAYAIVVGRSAVDSVYVALGLSHWGYQLTDQVGIVVFALIWLGSIVFMESYYSRSGSLGRLGRRVLRVTLIEAAILLVFGAARLLAFTL